MTVRGWLAVGDDGEVYAFPVAGALGSVTVTIDFGYGADADTDDAQIAATAAWVTPTTQLTCQIYPHPTDHDTEDMMLEGILAYVGDIVAGVGFTIFVRAPTGTWGRYIIVCRGA